MYFIYKFRLVCVGRTYEEITSSSVSCCSGKGGKRWNPSLFLKSDYFHSFFTDCIASWGEKKKIFFKKKDSSLFCASGSKSFGLEPFVVVAMGKKERAGERENVITSPKRVKAGGPATREVHNITLAAKCFSFSSAVYIYIYLLHDSPLFQ